VSLVRFMFIPGEGISRRDGQRHHISAPKLRRLYGEPIVTLRPKSWVSPSRIPAGLSDERVSRFYAQWWPWVIPLTPRHDGDYSLTKAVFRWAPFALTAFKERMVKSEARLAASLQRCADLGARLEAFERRSA